MKYNDTAQGLQQNSSVKVKYLIVLKNKCYQFTLMNDYWNVNSDQIRHWAELRGYEDHLYILHPFHLVFLSSNTDKIYHFLITCITASRWYTSFVYHQGWIKKNASDVFSSNYLLITLKWDIKLWTTPTLINRSIRTEGMLETDGSIYLLTPCFEAWAYSLEVILELASC